MRPVSNCGKICILLRVDISVPYETLRNVSDALVDCNGRNVLSGFMQRGLVKMLTRFRRV